MGRASELNSRIGAVGASSSEIQDLSASRRVDSARRLGRHHRLEVDLVDYESLDQLTLDDWPRDFKNRLVFKKERAFRH